MLADQALGERHRIHPRMHADEIIEGAIRRRDVAGHIRGAQGLEDRQARGVEPREVRAGKRSPDLERGNRGVLRHGRRADQNRVLDLVDGLGKRFRDHHVSDSPARHPVGLRQREERNGVSRGVGEAPGREVRDVAVGEIFVGLVVNVKDAPIAAEGVDGAKRRFGIHGAGRIVRRHRDDRAGARRDRGIDGPDVQLIVAGRWHRNRLRPGHHDGHLVIEVIRHEQHDLVAGIRNRQDSVHERLVAASRHEHAARRPEREVVFARELGLDGFDERWQAFDRPVTVVSQRAAEAARGLDRLARRLVGHDALPERNRAGGFGRPPADDRYDGRLDGGEATRLLVRGVDGVLVHAISITALRATSCA